MKILLLPLSGIIIALAALLYIPVVHAGGCCYLYFTAASGKAAEKDAVIDVAFVDPRSLMENPSNARPLANEKIIIHSNATRPDQGCRTESERTNDKGAIRATCTSGIPGTLSVWFSAPDMERKFNDIISYTRQTVAFEGQQLIAPTIPPISRSSQPPQRTVTVMVTRPTDNRTDTTDIRKLQEKIDALEKEVVMQRNKSQWFPSILIKLRVLFNGLFGRGK